MYYINIKRTLMYEGTSAVPVICTILGFAFGIARGIHYNIIKIYYIYDTIIIICVSVTSYLVANVLRASLPPRMTHYILVLYIAVTNGTSEIADRYRYIGRCNICTSDASSSSRFGGSRVIIFSHSS